jgi:oligoribonuclease
MTGLDLQRERIIEVAALITDGELNVLAEGPNLVIHQPDDVLSAMDEWNTRHHGSSGLSDRVRRSTLSEAEAESQLLAFLSQHTAAGKAPLAGNSVHQDRAFLARYMPRLEQFLHYRIIDVSTIKELAKRWYPTEFAARPAKAETHRALDDIRESLAELRYYRAMLFK